MELLIGAGLFLTGLILNKDNEEKETSIYDNKNYDKDYKFVDSMPINYYDNYLSNIYVDSNEFLYGNISNLYKKSMVPGSNIVNNIYRIINDPINKEKKKEIDDLLYKDINTIKKTYNNNI